MARWTLMQPHYLPIEGTEWEYEETSRETGERVRHRFPVPKYIDPADPKQQNRQGEVVVAYREGAQRGDIIFTGPPTPDMFPIDDEAETISAGLRSKWEHPIEGLPSVVPNDFSQSLITMLQRQIDNAALAQPSTDAGQLAAMQKQIAELTAKNAELEAAKPTRRA